VLLSRDMSAEGTPDQVLAIFGKFESLVIVTHDRDFTKYRQMLPTHARREFSEGAAQLMMDVEYGQSLQRIRDEIRAVEFVYEEALAARKPFIMTIQKVGYRVISK